MIGRTPNQDRAWNEQLPGQQKAPISLFGMQNQYRLDVRAGYAVEPQNLLPQGHSRAEHNVLKAPMYLAVAQLATPRRPPQTAHLISFRAFLGSGNQSLAGT